MEDMVEAMPPLEVKIKLSEDWIEEKINTFLPFTTVQNGAEIVILKPLSLSFKGGLIKLEVLANLTYQVSILGAVAAHAKMVLEFTQLADIELLKVKLAELTWIEEPKFKTNLGFGFSVKRIANNQLEKVKKTIAPTLESKIPEAFESFTNTNALYENFLTQELKEQGLQVKTKLKTLFYQLTPSNRWLDLQTFPVLQLNISDQDNSFISTPGPFRPGVGGGQIDFEVDLTPAYLDNLIAAQLNGKTIKAGSKSVTIEQLKLFFREEGLAVELHFENAEPPMMKGMLFPNFDLRSQILSFQIKQLELENASWFWRGLLSLLKSNIESRIEKSLKVNIQEVATKQLENKKTQIEKVLMDQGLELKSYRPNIVFTNLITTSSTVTILGKMGGVFECWSEHKTPKSSVIV